MTGDLAAALDTSIGKTSRKGSRYTVIKIFGRQVEAFEELFAAGGAHGQQESPADAMSGIFELEHILARPQSLATIDQGFELSRHIIKKHRGSGNDNAGVRKFPVT